MVIRVFTFPATTNYKNAKNFLIKILRTWDELQCCGNRQNNKRLQLQPLFGVKYIML